MADDTRQAHGLECYCEECCDTAVDWYTWRSADGELAGGPRYWTIAHALAHQEAAAADGLTALWREGFEVADAPVETGR